MEQNKVSATNTLSPKKDVKPLGRKATIDNKEIFLSLKKSNYDEYLNNQKAKKQKFKKILKQKKNLEKQESIAKDLRIKKQKQNDPERKNRFKRLFFGVGKEFWRVTWPKKIEMLNNFVTVIIITLVLAGILTGVTFLITNFVN